MEKPFAMLAAGLSLPLTVYRLMIFRVHDTVIHTLCSFSLIKDQKLTQTGLKKYTEPFPSLFSKRHLKFKCPNKTATTFIWPGASAEKQLRVYLVSRVKYLCMNIQYSFAFICEHLIFCLFNCEKKMLLQQIIGCFYLGLYGMFMKIN